VRGGTSLTCSLGVAPCKVVAKVASDARKPGGLTVVVPGQEAAYLAGLDVRRLPGVGPKAEQRLRGRRSRHGRARLRRSATTTCPGCCPGASAPFLRGPCARHRSARARARHGAHLDQRREHVRPRPRRPRAPARRAARDGGRRRRAVAQDRPGRADGDDEAPLRRLLHPQPLDLARRRHRRPGADRRARVPVCSTAASATAPARCGSSGSASQGSPRTASSRSRPARPSSAGEKGSGPAEGAGPLGERKTMGAWRASARTAAAQSGPSSASLTIPARCQEVTNSNE